MTIAIQDTIVNVKVILGRQVKRLRLESGTTQEVIAERAGIFRTYLSRIERGTANPSISVLVALAASLGVEIHELLIEAKESSPVTASIGHEC